MNLLAAAAAPAQQSQAYNPAYNQAYQNTTMQPDKPVAKLSIFTRAFIYGNIVFNFAVVIILVVMVCKFVWAFEKIAHTLENGVTVKKDQTTT